MNATNNIVRFSVYLRFGTVNGARPRSYDEFLDYLPYFLQTICEKEIRFEIEALRRKAVRTDIHLSMNVFVPPARDVSDAEAQRYGIKDPTTVRATTALLLWFCTLRIEQAGPIRDAWLMWCAQEGMDPAENPLPVYLHAHGFKHQHEHEYVAPNWQNLTLDPQPPTD
jgi:hypothetical protein